MKVKLVITALVISLLPHFQAKAQTTNIDTNAAFRKNNIKLNIFGLIAKTASVQYERGLTKDISVALGLRLQPKTSLPAQGTIKNYIPDQGPDGNEVADDFIANAKTSNWAITPEFRYYFGKRPMAGFYVAPFARFTNYNLEWKYIYVDDQTQKTVPLDFNGKGKSTMGGIMFGAQWHTKFGMSIDWWILGGMYGNIKVNMEGRGLISGFLPEEAQRFEQDVTSDFAGDGSRITIDFDGDKVNYDRSGVPWGGLRTGLCMATRFNIHPNGTCIGC